MQQAVNSEYDPAGSIEAKVVEEVFQRFASILHVHVGGRVIRTTGEHPFYAYNWGWSRAAELVAGDWILTASGEWKEVEEAYETGEGELV